MAEATVKTISGIALQSSSTQLFFIRGTTAANNDTFTVSGLTTVIGAFLISTTGTAGTMTFSTNVITITNASTLIWTGLCWGTP